MCRWLRPLFLLALAAGGIAAVAALDELPPPGPNTGNAVEWRGWSFRWSLRPREGLALTDIRFQGRQVLKYAGLVEIFVPYDQGQPRPEDSYEGMGATATELLPGSDCFPGSECQMFDAEGGQRGKRVVAMHEEPTGLLYMGEQGRAYGRMLVLWCMSRMGGYTYLTRWRFRDDGRIMPQMGLTGRLDHLRTGPTSPHGHMVERRPDGQTVFAPSHVHNFYFRLDFDIDGPADDVVEEFAHRPQLPGSAVANDGWTLLARETQRPLAPTEFRSWRVADRRSTNALGHRRSYEIFPGGNGEFRGRRDEAFAQAALYVTRYRPNEFPFSAVDRRAIKQALPTYLDGEPIAGEDVVLWYVMSAHHFPRSEDWPAMPIEWVGFEIVPRDFLDRSPLRPNP